MSNVTIKIISTNSEGARKADDSAAVVVRRCKWGFEIFHAGSKIRWNYAGHSDLCKINTAQAARGEAERRGVAEIVLPWSF